MEEVFNKDQVRSKYIKLRQEFSRNGDSKKEADEQICSFLLALLTQFKFSTVAIYNALVSEVNLQSLIPRLEISWVYPRVDGHSLLFFSHKSSFEKNQFGVEEPLFDPQFQVPLQQIPCVLVPGVCFDHNGHRMGMGKGFYDRTLEKYSGLKIGVGYSVQFSAQEIPYQDHDIKMDYLVNENFILKVS